MKKIIFSVLVIAIIVMTACTSQNGTSKEADIDFLPAAQGTTSAQNETSKNFLPPVQENITVQYEFSELEHAYVTVDGMDCPSCAIGIEYSLKDLGVTDASISPGGTGEIIYNPAMITENELKAAAAPYLMAVIKTEPAKSYSLN